MGTPLRTVLTVDDSPTIRRMLQCTLSEAGYEVVQACDGEDGLAMLETGAPDAIITDINMPRLDGFGFIEGVRKQPRFRGRWHRHFCEQCAQVLSHQHQLQCD